MPAEGRTLTSGALSKKPRDAVVGISPGAGGDAIGELFFGDGDDFDLDFSCLGGKNIPGGGMSLELIPIPF